MSSGEPSAAERVLAARVMGTLLREDYGGLSSRVRAHRGEPVLDLPAAQGQAGPRLPLERDGFLADLRVQRAPSDPRERYLPGVRARLARLRATTPGAWSGPAGLARYEALAAAMPHPAYPASEARLGLSADDCVRYAPEYHPEFTLRWVAVPRSRLVTASGHGHRPPGWPEPAEGGLPASLTATHDPMPAHPLTARRQLAGALDEAGLNGTGLAASSPPGALVAPGSGLWVTPTLSTRTVAVTADPRTHLKLPLSTATLGRRNRRFIRPGTLADGALVREILATAVQGDPLLGGLLIADESSYAHRPSLSRLPGPPAPGGPRPVPDRAGGGAARAGPGR